LDMRSSLARFFPAARPATRCQSPDARKILAHASPQTPAQSSAAVPPQAHIARAARPIRARESPDPPQASESPPAQYRNLRATHIRQSGLFPPAPETLAHVHAHFLPCAAAISLRRRSVRSTRESRPHLSVEPTSPSRPFLLCADPCLGFGKSLANGCRRRASRYSSSCKRCLERQRSGKIRFECRRIFFQLRDRPSRISMLTPICVVNHLPNNFVRLPERNPFRHQIIRRLGSNQRRIFGSLAQIYQIEFSRANCSSRNLRHRQRLVMRIEERFFVLLQIALVARWQAFHRDEQR